MTTEADNVKLVALEASRKGARLLRNNSGATYDKTGRLIRYGLGVGSPDLVGGKMVIITPSMVGKTILQVLAREVKPSGWVYKGTDHEKRQKAMLDCINKMGGDAAFATGEGTI